MKTHITGFGIENFRVFKNMQNFNFAPITILTGTNSSGKSTLTKAIMLLKESMNKNKLSKLEINTPYLKIGGFLKNLNDAKKENAYFKIEFNNHIHRRRDSRIRVTNKTTNTSLLIGYDTNGIFKTELSIDDKLIFYWENLKVQTAEINKAVKWKYIPQKINFDSAKYEQLETTLGKRMMKRFISEVEKHIQEIACSNQVEILYTRDFFYIIDILKDSIKSLIDDSIYFYFYDEDDVPRGGYRSELPKIGEIISSDLSYILSEDITQLFAHELIKGFETYEVNAESISKILNQILYIPGVRAKQEIVFTIDEYPLLCEVLNRYAEYIKRGGKIRMVTHDGYEVIKEEKYSFLEKWLVNEFKIVKKLSDLVMTPIEGYGVVVNINSEISLNQVGYGFTQLLPLILQIVFLENNVIIIEEPESNLHPALQSKLADFFSEAAKEFEIQFIIETHSEYLIRRLQYLTAKKEIEAEDTQIYYFYPPNDVPKGEKQVYPINITNDGKLNKNFGKGFFDEADNIALELFLLNNNQSN